MSDDANSYDEERTHRRQYKNARSRSPRAARSTQRKKRTIGYGGTHQRRNKHWSW